MTIGSNVAAQLVATLQVNMSSGTVIYVANADGIQQAYAVSSGSTFTLDVTGGSGVWTLKLAKYGKLSQTFTFTPSLGGAFSYSTTLLPDTSISEVNASVVGAYSALATPDQIYDYAAYYETTNIGIALARLATKQATYVNLGSYNVNFVSTGNPIVVSGNNLSLNITNFGVGATFTSGITTTGSINYGSAVLSYPVLLQSSTGQNYWLSLSLASGSSIYVTDNASAQYDYVSSSATTYRANIAAGSTGTWACKVAKYGSISQSFNFSPSGGGVNPQIISLQNDLFVTDTLSNVIAYTKLSNLDKLYDYAAYYETTNIGISISRVITKAASSVSTTFNFVLSNIGSVFSIASNTLTVNTGVLAKGITYTDGLVTSGNLTLSTGTQASSTGAYASLTASNISLPGGINYQSLSCSGAISGLPTTGRVSSGGSINFGSSTITPSGNLSLSNTNCAGTLTVATSSNKDIELIDCSGYFSPAITGAGSARFILSGITQRSILPASMPGSTIIAPSTISFSGLVAGSRVVVKQAGVLKDSVLTTGTSAVFSTEYLKGDTLTYDIYHPNYQQLHSSATLTLPLVNNFAITQVISDGIESTTSTVKYVNGALIDSNGSVSIDTAGKVITFEKPVKLRQALAAIQKEWATNQALYAGSEPIPFNLDSVQGIEIANTYTIVNPDNSNSEGWVLVDSLRNVTQVNYDFVSSGNESSVILSLIYDGVPDTPITVAGEQDRILLNLNKSTSTVAINALLKRQDIVFINRTETIKQNGAWQKFFKNENTNFTETIDSSVTQLLPKNESAYRLVRSAFQPPLDNNGTQHSFDRVIEISVGTQTRSDLINQLAAVATFDDFYTAKPYSIDSDGKVVMTPGTWVRQRDGSAISGNAAAFLKLSSVQGGQYVRQEVRIVNLYLDQSAIEPVSYVIYKQSDSSILLDASGIPITGSINPGEELILTIQSSVSIPITLATVSPAYSENYANSTIVSGTSNIAIVPTLSSFVIPTPSQQFSDPTTGTLSWNSAITGITFNEVAKDIVIPTELQNGLVVKNYNLAYVYFAWRLWILADVRRMRYGYAVYAEHQLAPSGSVDYSYKFMPGVWFDAGWALNVEPSRLASDIIQIQASNVSRRDGGVNSGLVYRSPLSNGATTMATVVIAGAATEVIRNAYQQSVDNYIKIQELKTNIDSVSSSMAKQSSLNTAIALVAAG